MEKKSLISREVIERAAKRMRDGHSSGRNALPRELQIVISWKELSAERVRECFKKALLKERGI
ncbi:hypothetical protein [Pseudomonas abieticivorans]|uniref:hypothetical protein n=1 Tax=Pseudomonas abieticivorans TaxID=2931382 RepID=UPI0020BF11B5|nr:hypothetical protein [Pseudomonas sp. PIA16]